MNTTLIVILIVSSIIVESKAEADKVNTIFDIIFDNWKTASIASLGILSDLFFKRIPYLNERNTTRLFNYIDENSNGKVDISEFETYLVKLFHAQDVVSFQIGRSVKASEITDYYKLTDLNSQKLRWNCFVDKFDTNGDSFLDLSEFKLTRRRSQTFSCIVCIKYMNKCISFDELYIAKF